MLRKSLKFILVLLAIYLGAVVLSHAVIFQTIPRALKNSFAEDAKIKRKNLFLTKKKLKKAQALAGSHVKLGEGLVTYYQGFRNGKLVGTVFIDTHRVRTLNETLLILVSPSGKIEKIEVLRFLEPQDYMLPERWVNQLLGKTLTPGLNLNQDIAGITGATLTAQAYTLATRRVLAYYKFIR